MMFIDINIYPRILIEISHVLSHWYWPKWSNSRSQAVGHSLHLELEPKDGESHGVWPSKKTAPAMTRGYPLVICYIAMERSTMPLIGKPSISIRAIEKPWRTVSHNQRVSALWATFFHQNLEEQSGFLICGIHPQRTTAIPLVSPCLGPWKLRLQKLRQQTQGWANGSRSVDIDWNVSWFTFDNRRKFRSQTSDNMDKWKAEQGRGREKRKIRRKKSRRERVRRKKMQMREKVGKSRNTVFSNDLWLRRVEK